MSSHGKLYHGEGYTNHLQHLRELLRQESSSDVQHHDASSFPRPSRLASAVAMFDFVVHMNTKTDVPFDVYVHVYSH